ncbi:MAG TPA: hypothetical protein DEB39_05810 [Planctomycetaceae bacterium]|nr:hypothetical protein [Planctomycetaceae bacterium]
MPRAEYPSDRDVFLDKSTARQPVLLIATQVYVPDPAALGQLLHDLAREIASRHVEVHVVASDRGYDDPRRVFPKTENRDGVHIRRIKISSFGKRTLFARIFAQFFFLVQAFFLALFTRNLRGILVSTSPPFASLFAIAVSLFRRVPIIYWVMDINPDQAVSLGLFPSNSIFVRMFDLLNRRILRRARLVVTLDDFMRERLLAKLPERERDAARSKIKVIPPWPLNSPPNVPPETDEPEFSERHAFREKHGWSEKFVLMYSGNHSLSHPIATVLETARRFAPTRPEILFVFVGGGSRKREVEAAIQALREEGGTVNLVSLPYQPFRDLDALLAAADVHLIAIGNASVGIVHPSKIYGAMLAGKPILVLGPRVNHASFLWDATLSDATDDWTACGRQVEQGDTEGMVRAVGELADLSPQQRRELGSHGRRLVQRHVSREKQGVFLAKTIGELLAPK